MLYSCDATAAVRVGTIITHRESPKMRRAGEGRAITSFSHDFVVNRGEIPLRKGAHSEQTYTHSKFMWKSSRDSCCACWQSQKPRTNKCCDVLGKSSRSDRTSYDFGCCWSHTMLLDKDRPASHT